MKHFFIFAFSVLFLLGGCSQNNENTGESPDKSVEQNVDKNTGQDPEKTIGEPFDENGEVAAVVNGKPIYKSEIEGTATLERLVLEEVLYQAALKNGIDEKIRDAVEEYQRRLVVSSERHRMMESIKLKNEDIPEEDVQNYYNEHIDKYTIPRIEYITVKKRSVAKEVLEKLKEGSTTEQALSGLKKGTFSTDERYNQRHASYFESLEPGATSDIIDEGGGNYTVLRIVDTKRHPVEKVKGSILLTLNARKKLEKMEGLSREIADKNGISVELKGTD